MKHRRAAKSKPIKSSDDSELEYAPLRKRTRTTRKSNHKTAAVETENEETGDEQENVKAEPEQEQPIIKTTADKDKEILVKIQLIKRLKREKRSGDDVLKRKQAELDAANGDIRDLKTQRDNMAFEVAMLKDGLTPRADRKQPRAKQQKKAQTKDSQIRDLRDRVVELLKEMDGAKLAVDFFEYKWKEAERVREELESRGVRESAERMEGIRRRLVEIAEDIGVGMEKVIREGEGRGR